MKKHPLTLALALAAVAARADFVPENEYFVGVDGLRTIASGTYAGLANPNYGRLSFLYGHQYDGSGANAPESSHYHSKAILTYAGSAASPTVVTSSSDYVPEGANPPLNLLQGAGSLSGYYVSGLGTGHFANTTLRPTAWLNRDGAKLWETTAYGSSLGRWNGSLGKANVALEVVGLSAGLRILNLDGTVAADAAGDRFGLGGGDFATRPIFGVSSAAVASTTYAARLRLKDLNGVYGDSGTFEFRFQAQPVPEPASMAALGIGALGLLKRRRRKA